jgi:hypothetical protein
LHAQAPNAATDNDEIELPSDVEAGLMFLRQECLAQQAAAAARQQGDQHRASTPLPPVVLTTQLCSIIHDKQNVEEEVERLRLCGALRVIKLATGECGGRVCPLNPRIVPATIP